jgi:hypothetical protein
MLAATVTTRTAVATSQRENRILRDIAIVA